MKSRVFDVLVVGGGVVGAGVAREAVLRGFETALVEKRDFASGTSGKSSKLIHGGLRYLQQGRIMFVRQSLRERETLRRQAEGIIRPLRFLIPVYKGVGPSPKLLRLGIALYNLLGGRTKENNGSQATKPTPPTPPLKKTNLEDIVGYLDYMTDDAWLTVRNIVDAHRRGATIANYVQVVGFHHDGERPAEVVCRDVFSGEEFTVVTRVVVNATGPWLDDVRRLWNKQSKDVLRPSKGVHIIVSKQRLPVEDAVVLFSPVDRRPVFLLPRGETVIVGTTDTEYSGDFDAVAADEADVNYLLDSVNHYLEDPLSRNDVLATYASLRPLVAFGAERTVDESRKHKVFVEGNMVSVGGGKLTTYRIIADDVIQVVEKILKNRFGVRRRRTASSRQVGFFEKPDPSDIDKIQRVVKNRAASGRLVARYGGDVKLIAAILEERPELVEHLTSSPPVLSAEAVYCARFTMVTTLEDFMLRRSGLFFEDVEQGRTCSYRAAELIGGELGWDEAERLKQVRSYLSTITT